MPALTLPDPCLVLLVGPSGSGKSWFAGRHFGPTEVLSSDAFRGMVSDDEADQQATRDAFDVLHLVARKRLGARRFTVIDATNLRADVRRSLVRLAGRFRLPSAAIVLDLPEEACLQRNRERPERQVDRAVVRRQVRLLRRSLLSIATEGFEVVCVLSSVEEAQGLRLVRRPQEGAAGPG